MHCAQTTEDIDTISFAYDSPMSLPHNVEIWLASVDPFLPKFCSKVTHPLLISALESGDIRWQIVAVHWSQWRAYRKPPLLFRMMPSGYDLPFSHNVGPIFILIMFLAKFM